MNYTLTLNKYHNYLQIHKNICNFVKKYKTNGKDTQNIQV